MAAHPYAQILRALADNETTPLEQYVGGRWRDCSKEAFFADGAEDYRLKPITATICINGVTVAAPTTVGTDKHYYVQIVHGDNRIGRAQELAFFHADKEESKAHWDALVRASTPT